MVKPNESMSLVHGDKLKIGQNELLLHIHAGSTTCNNCEPGEVIARLAKTNKKTMETENTANTESLRRETNRELKKK